MAEKINMCPHCNNAVSAGNIKEFGSPFRICPHCNQEYVETGYREAALHPNKYRPKVITIKDILIGLACIAGSIVFWALAQDTGRLKGYVVAVILFIMGFIIPISAVTSYKDRVKEYEAALKESEERISDPEYMEKLRSYGII